jgi:hypothetical protein
MVNHWCRSCSVGKKELCDYEDIARKHNGEYILDDIPRNNQTPAVDGWRCSKGHIFTTTYNSVRLGVWCMYCNETKVSPDDYKNLAKSKGGEFNGEIPQRTIHTCSGWICENGHEFEASYDKVRQRGSWCTICKADENDANRCTYIFKQKSIKGERCPSRVVDSSLYCRKHQKKNTSDSRESHVDNETNDDIVIRNDGYINATKLCQDGGRSFKCWYKRKQTHCFLRILSDTLDTPIDKLVQYQNGGNEIRSTWVHAQVAIHIAQWVSSDFAVSVSKWIQEWRKSSKNEFVFVDKINHIVPDKHMLMERSIQEKLAKEINGEIEVECQSGRVDIVSDTDIVEVKFICNWKHAIGQVLSYNTEFKKQCRIHLYYYDESQLVIVPVIRNVCNSLNITLSLEHINDIV